jgi:hypothetical protein
MNSRRAGSFKAFNMSLFQVKHSYNEQILRRGSVGVAKEIIRDNSRLRYLEMIRDKDISRTNLK